MEGHSHHEMMNAVNRAMLESAQKDSQRIASTRPENADAAAAARTSRIASSLSAHRIAKDDFFIPTGVQTEDVQLWGQTIDIEKEPTNKTPNEGL